MSKRAPARAWLRWLLLAAFASCLNPKPDEEPMATGPEAPGDKDEPSGAGAGSGDRPPLLIGNDDTEGAGAEPGEQMQTPTGSAADAGVPPGDAGVTSSDAGPL
jgi:hypothetical protein